MLPSLRIALKRCSVKIINVELFLVLPVCRVASDEIDVYEKVGIQRRARPHGPEINSLAIINIFVR